MDDRKKRVLRRYRAGWLLMAASAAMIATVIFTMRSGIAWGAYGSYMIMVCSLGVIDGGYRWIRYRQLVKDDKALDRLAVQELDERMVTIRNRAGNRAYFVSMVFVCAGVSWSFVIPGSSLAPFSWPIVQGLWAAALIVPFTVSKLSELVESRAV